MCLYACWPCASSECGARDQTTRTDPKAALDEISSSKAAILGLREQQFSTPFAFSPIMRQVMCSQGDRRRRFWYLNEEVRDKNQNARLVSLEPRWCSHGPSPPDPNKRLPVARKVIHFNALHLVGRRYSLPRPARSSPVTIHCPAISPTVQGFET